MQRLGKTPTLGVMMERAVDPYQDGILKGVLEAAKNVGTNVLCFVGGALRPSDDPSPRNLIFELIGTQNVAGVTVLTSPLTHFVGRTGFESFCTKHFHDILHSSIGVALEGIPSVVASNTSGIEHLMSHLVREHNLKRIAFVRGPLANDEAEMRYQSYVQMLKKFDLALDPRLVVVGDFLEESGRAAVRGFEHTPGLCLDDLDAIVASNDNMAIGVGLALEELGIMVPSKIAVTGFDDIDEARLTASPLTTVRQPLEKLGKQAARDLLNWIQVGAVPQSVEVETDLVIRRSCGCAENGSTTRQSAMPEHDHSFAAVLVMRRQHILDKLTRTARGELGLAGADCGRSRCSMRSLRRWAMRSPTYSAPPSKTLPAS